MLSQLSIIKRMNNLIKTREELDDLEKILHIKNLRKMNSWWILDLIKQIKMRKNVLVYLEKIMKIGVLLTK